MATVAASTHDKSIHRLGHLHVCEPWVEFEEVYRKRCYLVLVEISAAAEAGRTARVSTKHLLPGWQLWIFGDGALCSTHKKASCTARHDENDGALTPILAPDCYRVDSQVPT